MRVSIIVSLTPLFLLLLAPLTKARADCRLTDEEFMKQLAKMKDWPGIYAVFKRNLPGCPDDGFFAEGFYRAARAFQVLASRTNAGA